MGESSSRGPEAQKGVETVCVDLREPNKSIIADCHPLPHMEDLFSELAGATHYSQIDLSSAYHQLPLHPESRKLIAFITHEGLFQFTRVPFGLASAPSAFQEMMQTVLKICLVFATTWMTSSSMEHQRRCMIHACKLSSNVSETSPCRLILGKVHSASHTLHSWAM